MKIESSSVAMASSHSLVSYSYRETAVMTSRASDDIYGAVLALSEEAQSGSYVKDMEAYRKKQEQEQREQQEKNQIETMKQYLQQQRDLERINDGKDPFTIPDEYDGKIEMLRKMLEILRYGKIRTQNEKHIGQGQVRDLRSETFGASAFSFSSSVSSGKQVGSPAVGTTTSGTLWQRVTAETGFATEWESTSFASVGQVHTTDGRQIDFQIEVSFSRTFVSSFNRLTAEEYVLTDPLIINLDTDAVAIDDQKFFFDLDADGEAEEISFARPGSGFVALDKNGDGHINDGSELFGTQSGDGFRDLAAYDEDGNGWIDENDSIFSSLKIWTKGSDGEDLLLDFKQADVGAIYLGNADTEFSFKDEENRLNGVMRKTGIYLKESTGAVGTINHVDLSL